MEQRVRAAERCSELTGVKTARAWRDVEARKGKVEERKEVGIKKRWPARPSFPVLILVRALLNPATAVAMRLAAWHKPGPPV